MSIRLSKIAKELNVGADTVAEYLAKKGHQIPSDLNHLLTDEQEQILRDGLSANKKIKQDSERITQQRQIKEKKESVSIEGYEDKEEIKTVHETHTPKIIGKIDLDNFSSKRNPSAKKQETDTTSEPVEAPQKTAAAPEEVVNSANVGIEKFAEKKEGSTPQPAEPQKSDEKQEEEVFSLAKPAQTSINVVGKIDLSSINQQTRPKKKTKEEKKKRIPVGVLAATIMENTWYLSYIAVEKELRRQGIGRALVSSLIDMARGALADGIDRKSTRLNSSH